MMQILRKLWRKLKGCFLGPSNEEPVLPPTIKTISPSSQSLHTNILPSNTTLQQRTNPVRNPSPPSPSPPAVATSVNSRDVDLVFQLAVPPSRSSANFTASNTSTLDQQDRDESELGINEPETSQGPGNTLGNTLVTGLAYSDLDIGVLVAENNESDREPLHDFSTDPCLESREEDDLLANPDPGSETIHQATNTDSNRDKPLREQMSDVHYEPYEDCRYFIAADDLQRLMKPDKVLRELKRIGVEFACTNTQQQTAERISEVAPKLFAALVYARLGRYICKFLDEGIDDSDLPFVRSNDDPSVRNSFKLCSSKLPDEPIRCISTWKHSDISQFVESQYWMLADVFEFTEDIEHYEIDDHCIPPFIKDHEKTNPRAGAYGKVWKIEIHPAHQRIIHGTKPEERDTEITSDLETQETECPYPYLVVKRLHYSDEAGFNKEVAMSKELRKHPHPHLIKLLATFRWKNSYYLIFPYAELNLREYWKMTPKPAFSRDNVSWMLHQCKGVASGLHLVHEQCDTHALSDDGVHDVNSLYGRHGDIKPENILWFQGHETDFGLLVIADFGLTDFHKKDTRSDIPVGHITGSPSYQPPELIFREKISRAYDIWSLACVYLEFITWLVCGWDGLERFPHARAFESTPNLTDDTFFTILHKDSGGRLSREAVIRESVRMWIKDLHEMPRASDFVHDFLDLIEERMLVADPSSRINIGQVNRDLQKMINEKTSSYLIEGKPKQSRHQEQPHPFSLAVSASNGRASLSTSEGDPLPRGSCSSNS